MLQRDMLNNASNMPIQAYLPPDFSMIARAVLFALTLLLSGCDLESLLADPKVVQREADSKAIGSACRYGLRGIEDCYSLNEKASKAAVFTGWKEMDQYMRENKIEGVPAKDAKMAPTTEVAAGEEVVVADAPKTAKDAVKAIKKATETTPKAKAETAASKAEATTR